MQKESFDDDDPLKDLPEFEELERLQYPIPEGELVNISGDVFQRQQNSFRNLNVSEEEIQSNKEQEERMMKRKRQEADIEESLIEMESRMGFPEQDPESPVDLEFIREEYLEKMQENLITRPDEVVTFASCVNHFTSNPSRSFSYDIL